MSSIAKTIINTLEKFNAPLSTQELQRETNLTPKTLLDSVKKLIEKGEVKMTRSLADARVRVYYVEKEVIE